MNSKPIAVLLIQNKWDVAADALGILQQLESAAADGSKSCGPWWVSTRHVTFHPEIFIIIYNTSSHSEQAEHNQHSVRSEPGFILGLGWRWGRGYESVKRGVVTQTRNAQTVTLMPKSSYNMCCVWWRKWIGYQESKNWMPYNTGL